MSKQKSFIRLLEFFHQSNFANPGSLDYDAAFCKEAMTAASAEAASIWRLNMNRLTLTYGTNVSPSQVRDISLPLGEGVTGAAALSRRTIAINNAAHVPQHDQRIDNRIDFETRSMVSAPILFHNRLHGVLNILNHSSGRGFPPEWEERLAAAATIYGAALAQAEHIGSHETRSSGKTIKPNRENVSPRNTTTVVGISSAIQQVLHLCTKAAKTTVPVLIKGETGTGKELVARRIHEASSRASEPFLAVNSAALPGSLLESELFGHVKGAFTGATNMRKGKFVAAAHGTLFLDEIAELSKGNQAKILRALEEKSVIPLGSDTPVAHNARIITATNKDLAAMVRSGTFREDLYYRLCGMEISIPPLRQRKEDIFYLSQYFLSRSSVHSHTDPLQPTLVQLSAEAVHMLTTFSWPGNVRQLEQALLAAAATCDGDEIKTGDFPPWLYEGITSPAWSQTEKLREKRIPDHEFFPREHPYGTQEKRQYLEALEKTKYPGTGRWNYAAAARIFGIPRKTFTRRLRKLKIVSV